ncbi:MAG TPA: DUF4410 domain-containing protein [Burkholderiaceae bacterium]|nr:DUF4410 domain-containing protein [Burkholderiaceae bacterium]
MKPMTALVLVCCLAIAGCAGTSLNVQKSYGPTSGEKFSYAINPKVEVSAEALEIMETRLKSQLGDSLQASAGQSGKNVEISITNYYMRHGATRAMVGIMAGADNILSQVTVRDAASGSVLGEFVVESKNPSAWGTSRGLIEEHADKIVSYLKSGRN